MARPRSTTPSVRVTVTLDRIAALAHRLRASTASVVRRAVAELLEREHSPSTGERVAVQKVVQFGMPFVFYNYNASLAFAGCFDNVEDLSNIDWPLFFETPKLGGYCKYWKSMHAMPDMHEGWRPGRPSFSRHGRMPLELIIGIGTSSERTRDAVEQIAREHGVAVPVRSKPEWYY